MRPKAAPPSHPFTQRVRLHTESTPGVQPVELVKRSRRTESAVFHYLQFLSAALLVHFCAAQSRPKPFAEPHPLLARFIKPPPWHHQSQQPLCVSTTTTHARLTTNQTARVRRTCMDLDLLSGRGTCFRCRAIVRTIK